MYTRSEHHPLTYQASLHSVVSDSKAAQPSTDQPHTSSDTITPHRSKTRTPMLPISETPSTQTFDNTVAVELPCRDVPTVIQRHQRAQDSAMTSSSNSLANQHKQNETPPLDRHSLPDSVTSPSSTNQRRRSEMLDYFAVRRPQVTF